MLSHPRGGVSQKELRAIFAKLAHHKKIGFDRMTIYIMNQRNHRTGNYYTEEEARNIAGSIYRNQLTNKEHIARIKKP